MKNLTNKKPTLLFKKAIHRNSIRLLLIFKYDDVIISKIRALKLFSWSESLAAWYCNYDVNSILLVKKILENDVQFKYDSSINNTILVKGIRKNRAISDANKEVIRAFVRFLNGKRYSESTVKSYFNYIADFIEYVNKIPLKELTHREVELFLENVFVPKQYSISSQRQFISAVKQFVLFYPQCKIDELKLYRPKKSKFLPLILSKEEIVDLLRFTKNLKHRAIIALLYSGGLRISEL